MKIEIVIEGERNQHLFFRPLQRRIRGRFDLNLVAEPLAGMQRRQWPQPIPGQHLILDLKACAGIIREPLHDDEHALTRERIEASGVKLPPAEERHENIHLATWLFWAERAAKSGNARLITGEFPKDLGGEPQKAFISKPQPDKRDRLIDQLVGLLVATLPADKQKQVAELLAN